MKSNVSCILQKTTNYNISKNNQFFEIQHVFINLHEKKNSKQKNIKISDTLESKTNNITEVETVTTSNSKNIQKTTQTIETSEQETTYQKKQKPKIIQKKYYKLIEEFNNVFNNTEKKNINNSFSVNINLMKKTPDKFFPISKNNLIKINNNKIKSITSISRKTRVSNYSVDSALRKYETLSASIKNKHSNNKNRKISKQLEMNEKNFVNLCKKNKFIDPCCKEANLYTLENNKIEIKNFECDEIAQRRPGHSKLKKNDTTRSKKKTKQNITQQNCNKKKYENLSSRSNIKINTKKNNNLKKFTERNESSNGPSPIPYNKRLVGSYLKDLKNKNNIGIKQINNINIFPKNKSFKKKKLLVKNTEYNPKIFGAKENFDYLSKKNQITLENNSKDYKKKKKNFINLMNFRFVETAKNVKN